MAHQEEGENRNHHLQTRVLCSRGRKREVAVPRQLKLCQSWCWHCLGKLLVGTENRQVGVQAEHAQRTYGFWAVKLLICVTFPCACMFTQLKVSAAGDKHPVLPFLCVPIAGGALFVEGKRKQNEKSFRISFQLCFPCNLLSFATVNWVGCRAVEGLWQHPMQ